LTSHSSPTTASHNLLAHTTNSFEKECTLKITSVTVTWYQAPHERPIENSGFTFRASNKVIVRIQTDDGVIGTGWVNGTDLVMTIARDMGRRILGLDPCERDRVLARINDDKAYGRGGLSAKARSAIDIALWDIAGRVCGLPIHRMLGTRHSSIPAYVAGGYYAPGKTLTDLATEAATEVESGAHAFKMKIGLRSVAEDIERVTAVRNAIGPDIKLLVDANGGYDRLSARDAGRRLTDLDVFWFEEPIDSRDVQGQAELRERVGVAIASGESEYSGNEMRRAILGGAMDIVNPDAQCLDGITGWIAASALAAANGLLVAPHGDQEVHVHLAAAAPTAIFVEYYSGVNSLRDAMFTEKLELNSDGTVSPPDLPGLGFEIDEEQLAAFQMARLEARA
jgi:L-alanine-DL-glutamate epimerase-like enolase superfamily enzyme